MKIIYMGTPDFAVEALEALASSRHEVTAVFTQPDKPKGRGKAMQFTPVKEVALRENIPVYQPKKVRDPEVIQKIRNLHRCTGCCGVWTDHTTGDPGHRTVWLHQCAWFTLPKYRGAAPIQWAVIDGEKESGVTTMQMDAGLDTGDMLLKTVVPLDEKETGGSLFDKLSKAGADLLLKTLDALENGTVTRRNRVSRRPLMQKC